MKKIVDWITVKFILVGLINTAVGTTVMFLSYNLLHLSYWIEKSGKIVLKFVLNIMLCYLLAYGVAKPLAMKILSGAAVEVQENVAMLVGMVLFVGFNYLGQRYFAFNLNRRNFDAPSACCGVFGFAAKGAAIHVLLKYEC